MSTPLLSDKELEELDIKELNKVLKPYNLSAKQKKRYEERRRLRNIRYAARSRARTEKAISERSNKSSRSHPDNGELLNMNSLQDRGNDSNNSFKQFCQSSPEALRNLTQTLPFSELSELFPSSSPPDDNLTQTRIISELSEASKMSSSSDDTSSQTSTTSSSDDELSDYVNNLPDSEVKKQIRATDIRNAKLQKYILKYDNMFKKYKLQCEAEGYDYRKVLNSEYDEYSD